jgi:hypothetical protein
MAVKRTVTKSKKDGVKKKTVTVSGGKYRNKLTVTRSKTKDSRGNKKKTATATNRGGKVVATATKEKGGRKNSSVIKRKKVNLGRDVNAKSYAQRGKISPGGERIKTRGTGSFDNMQTKRKSKKNVLSLKSKRGRR